MISKRRDVPQSEDLATATTYFLESLGDWAHACQAKYADVDPTDVHDQGTYTTAWAPYIQATQDYALLNFLKERRNQIRDHFVTRGQWYHGYWRLQEAHHGTEHFEIFLGTLLRLDPTDTETQAQIMDAAEHIGNWVPDIPRWLDEETGLFRSMYLGTTTVRTEPGMDLNIPDHLRFVNLALLAYKISRAERYLDFAANYTRRWAETIQARQHLPIGLLPEGPVYDLTGDAEKVYRNFAGMAGHLDDDVDRAENLLASNALGAMLELWQRTQDGIFLTSTERLLDILVSQLSDPDAGAAADAIRTYRRTTGRRRYDAAVIQAFESAARARSPFEINTIGTNPDVKRPQRPHGIGKRVDAPEWYEDGARRIHSPILLAVAAEVQNDEALATRAVDLAHAYFNLARTTLRDGRHHGCAANTVSAVARGHGRENHAGTVTGVLGEIVKAMPPHPGDTLP